MNTISVIPPGPFRALIAEDHDVMRRIVTAMLVEHGVRVDVVENGLEAIAWLAANECDFVLTDLRMPVVDGLGVIDWVHSCRPGLPLVLMSAAFTRETEWEALRRGAAAVLRKPFDMAQLGKVLASLLPSRWVARGRTAGLAPTSTFAAH